MFTLLLAVIKASLFIISITSKANVKNVIHEINWNVPAYPHVFDYLYVNIWSKITFIGWSSHLIGPLQLLFPKP